jgi:hypothetical protein
MCQLVPYELFVTCEANNRATHHKKNPKHLNQLTTNLVVCTNLTGARGSRVTIVEADNHLGHIVRQEGMVG